VDPEGPGALRDLRKRLAGGAGRGYAAIVCVALLALLATLPAFAHPFMTRNVRVVQFDTLPDGRLVAYWRITLPLLVGRGIAPPVPGTPVPSAPYTRGVWESGAAFWYADAAAIARDPHGLGRLVLEGHTLAADSMPVAGELLSVAAHPKGHVPPFDTPAQARAATQPAAWPTDMAEIDSGYVVVDAAIAYSLPLGQTRFTLSSSLSPGALGEATTTNMFIDRRGGGAVYYRATGLLAEPVVVAPGLLEGMASFVRGGIEHILSGPDHLLFLLCLVLGAVSLGALAWRITGFTVGHSITLAAGFYGLAPKPVWFEPGIEAAIAASIVLAGMSTLVGRGGQALVLVTLGIGLIHGFGFSFALRDLLAADGPNVLPGLAGFNIGVELGQLAVGLAVFFAFRWLRRDAAAERRARFTAICAAMAIAVVWLLDRVPAVWAAAVG
jgi:HupE / UreJ protein